MPSDTRRLQQVVTHINRIKSGTYPQIVESTEAKDGGYRIVDRPWAEVPEKNKLAILQGAINWQGITDRDKGHILLSQIDPGKITDAQRDTLIRMATSPEKQATRAREAEMER